MRESRFVAWTAFGLAIASGCTGDPGGGAAQGSHDGATGGDAGNGATGGAPAGGTSAGAAGAAGNSGGAPGGDAPAPATPDLTGLIRTSGKWALFFGNGDDPATTSLILFDLESGESHELNDGGPPLDYTEWSPDGAAFLFSGSNADTDRNLRIVHLTDHGAVPARWVQGFAGLRGNLGFPRFSADSRFMVILRGGSMTDGVEVIDTVLDERLRGYELHGSFGASFAPGGYGFSFWERPDMGPSSNYYARITKSGPTPATTLPVDSGGGVFDDTSTRVYYATGAGGARGLRYDDVQRSSSTAVTLDSSLGDFRGSFTVGDGESLFLYSDHPDGKMAYTRISASGGQPPIVLSDPSKSVYLAVPSHDKKLLAIDYQTSLDLVRIEPYSRVAVPGAQTMQMGIPVFGMAGNHAYYQAADGLHLASLDANGALVDVAITSLVEAADPCGKAGVVEGPPTRLTLISKDRNTLTFVDASTPAARVVGHLPPVIGGRFTCPLWTKDGTTLGVVEMNSRGDSRLHVVPWSKNMPEAPVVPAVPPVVLFALSYR